METQTIFRLVHPILGVGPWNTHTVEGLHDMPDDVVHSIHSARYALNDHYYFTPEYSSRHRPIVEDFIGWERQYLCATNSLKTLREWFCVNDTVLNDLLDGNFTVMEYVVKYDFIIQSRSGRQVGFDPAGIVSERDLTILALIE